jgi:hypothetical protein
VRARRAVDALHYLDLLDVATLSSIREDATSDAGIIIGAVLRRQGYSAQEAQAAITILAHAATYIRQHHSGKIQLYLRRHGQTMADQLVATFADEALSEFQLRYAVTLWLQNAVSMPLSLPHPAVLRLCERYSATLDDLLIVADELDLNLAVIDDLLMLEEQAAGAEAAEDTPQGEEAQQ